ncbi:MAG TPA: bifunctional proline dehydrogenase/L-glutamate gamma-semialdehyde dehydrogenase PutA [Gammaproteobacteria bacterium]|nr:bifunctional proline dehydrogenase/L-glutamate gamma-semialdehyde dehydrogenase PutA [Gammaproteobacteria bacterium]
MYQPAESVTVSNPNFVFPGPAPALSPLRAAINELFLADETRCVDALLQAAILDAAARSRIQARAAGLVQTVRKNRASKGGIEEFLRQYDLSSQEGMVLMCLAEALLRIPDADTADKLIRDKIVNGNWQEHLGASPSLFVNASTWGLMLTGKLIALDQAAEKNLGNYMAALVARVGEPVIRTAFRQAMRIMGHQFVMGRTIEEALKRAASEEHRKFRHSYDMLGEAALTAKDAERYFQAYSMAIDAIGATVPKGASVFAAPSISVKLSALHPRYELAQHERVLRELTPKLVALAERAKKYGMGLTVDAEESERLDLSLDVIEATYRSPALAGWEGFGLAVQAYQKRAYRVLDWLIALAKEGKRRMPVRLVKGAYWDSEVKRAQERGLEGYPVFTRKASTDVSYLACARKMLSNRDAVYPMFATHNAQTLSSVLEMAGSDLDFEFQRLHGMGEELYGEVVGADKLGLNCRVYAPVGSHEDLLPYLVRRLLENGANTSFVNRIIDEKVLVEAIVADPVAEVEALSVKPHPRIPLPVDIYGAARKNSQGVNLADETRLAKLAADMQKVFKREWHAAPIVGGKELGGKEKPSLNPVDNRESVGVIREADADAIRQAVDVAVAAQPAWDMTPASERARILRKAADLFEEHHAELMALCVREAGKSIPDSVAEVREAVDFLRYYAERAEEDFGKPTRLPGPTGESNELWLQGRGVFVCISPWNFPLAIFTGQMAAALASGNAVLTKPAEQTSLIGAQAVRLLHQAGVPGGVLNFIPGRGSVVGQYAVADPRIAGVAFTGSTETAKVIHQTLANREGIIPALIAETGGQNAMLVDSSALPEQVVLDVVASSFNSAGQRCSALRVLFVQEEIADRVIEVLAGYLDELVIGNPAWLSTDVGPVIDAAAKKVLDEHKTWIKTQGKVIRELRIPDEFSHGTYVAPLAVELPNLDILKREVFGPVLHIIRFKGTELDKVIDSINRTGYGLTLGVHSRIDSQAQYIQRSVRVGNVYINRNMIGAVVGVQPFGGQGLSGTGPKAGGPHYMHRFATERTVTINTAAVGGNASLLSLKET